MLVAGAGGVGKLIREVIQSELRTATKRSVYWVRHERLNVHTLADILATFSDDQTTIVFDDIDCLFDDYPMVQMLNGAPETEKDREIGYRPPATKHEPIPKQQLNTFRLKIIFITNDYALGDIDKELWKNLHVIRTIRNEFAHTSFPIHFRSPEILTLLREFANYETAPQGMDPFAYFVILKSRPGTKVIDPYYSISNEVL